MKKATIALLAGTLLLTAAMPAFAKKRHRIRHHHHVRHQMHKAPHTAK